MEGEAVLYLGRTVPKDGFRAFIYGANNQTRLCNSWEEFEKYMASGIWHAEKSLMPAVAEIEKPINKKYKKIENCIGDVKKIKDK